MTAKKLFDMIKQHHPTMAGVEIVDLINEGSDEFCKRSEIFKQSYSQETTAGQRYYTIDDQIFKVLSVTLNEVAIPRLIGEINIDDDEIEGEGGDLESTYDLGAPAVASNERYWYEDLGRIAIVEKKLDAIKRNDVVSNYQSVSIVGLLRLRTISAPAHITTATVAGATILSGVPGNFARFIGDYCIAEGYRKPAAMNPQQADYFEMRFEKAIKTAKKQARARYITTGRIAPVDF